MIGAAVAAGADDTAVVGEEDGNEACGTKLLLAATMPIRASEALPSQKPNLFTNYS